MVNEELKQYFRPEFLNRLDEIIVFRQLNRRGSHRDRRNSAQRGIYSFSREKYHPRGHEPNSRNV